MQAYLRLSKTPLRPNRLHKPICGFNTHEMLSSWTNSLCTVPLYHIQRLASINALFIIKRQTPRRRRIREGRCLRARHWFPQQENPELYKSFSNSQVTRPKVEIAYWAFVVGGRQSLLQYERKQEATAWMGPKRATSFPLKLEQ